MVVDDFIQPIFVVYIFLYMRRFLPTGLSSFFLSKTNKTNINTYSILIHELVLRFNAMLGILVPCSLMCRYSLKHEELKDLTQKITIARSKHQEKPIGRCKCIEQVCTCVEHFAPAFHRCHWSYQCRS